MGYAIIKYDVYENGKVHDRREFFLVDGESDISHLSNKCAPGSVAYTSDHSMAWQMSPDHIWVSVVNVPELLARLDF